jgi:hypothetical protein
VESGSRYLLEDLLPGIYGNHPELTACDVLTCFPGQPKTLDQKRGRVWRLSDYPGRAGRARLFEELRSRHYTVLGIVCSGEAIMTKWKWAAALRLPAKVFILNENGDYFWFDRGNLGTIRHFVLFRMGLAGGEAVTTLLRLALFPFTLTYLLLFAAYVHLRRWART